MNNSFLLPDKNKTNLTQFDIFDRIINLKLTTGKLNSDGVTATEKDVYVVRSDYEVVYPDMQVTSIFKAGASPGKSYYIRKCSYKPSIKVQLKNVSPSVGIEIDIFLSNFYMLDASGKTLLSFSNSTYPLQKVELMMGYWGQFKEMKHDTFDDLKEFTPGFGVDVITINNVYVTTEKMPPDYTMRIHGYVGTASFSPPVGETGSKEYSTLQEAGLIETVSESGGSSAIEKLFFKYITRRFTKSNVFPEGKAPVATDGFMSEQDAGLYGVKVFCSEGVKNISGKQIQSKKIDSEGNEVDSKVYFNGGKNVKNTIYRILSYINSDLVFAQLYTGDYVVFTQEESLDVAGLTVSEDYGKDTALVKIYKNILPAVYNISITDARVIIVSPFFFFVNPFLTVEFSSRYTLSSLVSYYAEMGKDVSKFRIIQQSLSFATVDKINEMMLTGVIAK